MPQRSDDPGNNTLGYCFSFGFGCFFMEFKEARSCGSIRTEAKYVVGAAVNQASWLRKLLSDLDMKQEGSTHVFVDNQATISITNDPIFQGKSKHFRIKLYFLREVKKQGDILLVYYNTEC